MRTLSPLVLGTMIALTAAGPALAQAPIGDASQGRVAAQNFCGACHATSGAAMVSPNPAAKPFVVVAQRPELSAMNLSIWVRSSHPSMPLLRLEADTIEDIAAYLATLKRPPMPK